MGWWIGGRRSEGGLIVEGGGDGVSGGVDGGQELDGLIGLVDELAAVGEEREPLLIACQRLGELDFAAFEPHHDLVDLGEGFLEGRGGLGHG